MTRMLFVLILTLLGGWGLPWWWPAVPGFFAGAWGKWVASRRSTGILSAAIGGGVGWAVVALWIEWRNDGVLSARIAQLFLLPGGWTLIVVSALIGGITAALGAWAGVRLRKAYKSP